LLENIRNGSATSAAADRGEILDAGEPPRVADDPRDRRRRRGEWRREERPSARGPELGRWLFVGALLLIGLVLYFIYAPSSTPPAPPAAHEER